MNIYTCGLNNSSGGTLIAFLSFLVCHIKEIYRLFLSRAHMYTHNHAYIPTHSDPSFYSRSQELGSNMPLQNRGIISLVMGLGSLISYKIRHQLIYAW